VNRPYQSNNVAKNKTDNVLLGVLIANALQKEVQEEFGITGLELSVLLMVHQHEKLGMSINGYIITGSGIGHQRTVQRVIKGLVNKSFLTKFKLGKKKGMKLELTETSRSILFKSRFMTTRKLKGVIY
jgi:hypothetical protein